MSGLFTFLSVIAFVAMIVFVFQARKKRPGASRKGWLSAAAWIVLSVLSSATISAADRRASQLAQNAAAEETARKESAEAQALQEANRKAAAIEAARVKAESDPKFIAAKAAAAAKAQREADAQAMAQAQAETCNNVQLVVEDWNWSNDDDYVKSTGEVTNVSGNSLSSITANVSFYTSDSTFIKSSNGFLKYNPVLSGQTSTFETIDTGNPAMNTAKIEFSEFGGPQITTMERKQYSKICNS